jgi:hypothetical protein
LKRIPSHTTGDQSLSETALPVHLIHVLPIQQVALERLDNRIHFPLRTVLVHEKLLDAAPSHCAVELTVIAFVEELTMLLAHILFVFLAVSDFHFAPPFPRQYVFQWHQESFILYNKFNQNS